MPKLLDPRGTYILLLIVGLLFSRCTDGDFNDPSGSPQSRCLNGAVIPRGGGEISAGREDIVLIGCLLLFIGDTRTDGIITPEEAAVPIEERLGRAYLYCQALKQWRDGCYARSRNPYQ